MMTPSEAADWMLVRLRKDGSLYQDDVVDHLVKTGSNDLLKENADGNQVLATAVLTTFRELTEGDVVWVRPDRYWRFRVPEDDDGREARG